MNSRDSARFGDSQVDSDEIDKTLKQIHKYGREKDPFLAETMSEIYDDKDKRAVFEHTLREGVFNDIGNSPLKAKIPFNVQYYEPALKNRIFENEINRLKKKSGGELLNTRIDLERDLR